MRISGLWVWVLTVGLGAACSHHNSSNGGGDMKGGGGGGGGDPQAGEGIFPSDSPFYRDISKADKAGDSMAIINGVVGSGGWGNGNVFQIDFSIEVLKAADSDTPQAFTPTDDWYDPDCDSSPVPVPKGGRVEGETGYACTMGGDCHLLVVQGKRLYEMWEADIEGGKFNGGCLAVWDLTQNYWTAAAPPDFSRGDGCSSADAAGLPISPLLFSADEVKAGEIKHAIRFILPNDRIRHIAYVHPGTHATPAAKGGAGAPPYGSRWRLKPDFDLTKLKSDGARVVGKALQKYGMFLADGGNIALTGQSDTYTTAKWDNLLDARDLDAIKVSDFEVIDGGTAYNWGPAPSDCERTPLTN